MATAGSITVDLLLKTGSFQTDAERSSKAMKKLQRDIDDAAKKISAAFVAGVVGIGYLVKSTIDAQDHLNDLSKKTGIAADTLGGIGFAAEQAGGDLESAAAGAGKLNKSIAEAAAGNKEAKEAFDVLGISVRDAAGNTKKADVVLAEVADKFAGYADGPEKAALALRLFGKAGADMIPLLNEGGGALQSNIDYFKRYSGVTEESTKRADEFNDTQTKLKLLSSAFANTLTADLLPSLQALANLWLENKEKGDGFKGTAGEIADAFRNLAVLGAFTAESTILIAKGLGAVLAAAVALVQFDPKGAFRIGKEFIADIGAAEKRFDEFRAAINATAPARLDLSGFAKTAASFGGGSTGKPNAPGLSGGGTAKGEAKQKADQFIAHVKAFEEFMREQNDAFIAAAQAYESFYQQQLQVTKAFEAESEAAKEQAAVFGLSTDELHDFNREKLLAQAASLDLLAIQKGEKEGNETLARLYRQQAAAIRETAAARDFLSQKEHALHYDSLTGASKAIKDYLAEIEKAGDTTYRLVEDQLRNLEDALTQALTGGNIKSIARSFVDQIIAEVYRLYVVKPLLASIFGGGSSGGLGSILSLIDTFTSGYSVDSSGAGTASPAVPGRPRGGAATGTNMIERDMVTLLHKGEAVIPKAYNPAAGGRWGMPSIKVEKVPAEYDVGARQDTDGTLVLTMQRIARAEINRSARPGGAIRQGLKVQPPDRS